jgi:hypothetical protein
LSNRKSGGIVIYVRYIYSKYVSVIENDYDHILWIRIDGKAFNIQNQIIIGAVYIPPINSRFSTIDIFDELEREVSSFIDDSSSVCLFGDFNSRTATEKDFDIYN